jgi:hypothetical protein
MTIVPGFAKDCVGRRRIMAMEVTATSSLLSKRGLTSQGKPDRESPSGALKGFLHSRHRSAAPSSHPVESPFSGSLSTHPPRPLPIVEPLEDGVVSRSSHGIPALWDLLPEVHSGPLR